MNYSASTEERIEAGIKKCASLIKCDLFYYAEECFGDKSVNFPKLSYETQNGQTVEENGIIVGDNFRFAQLGQFGSEFDIKALRVIRDLRKTRVSLIFNSIGLFLHKHDGIHPMAYGTVAPNEFYIVFAEAALQALKKHVKNRG
jgi:hypothetical protein